MTEGNDNNNKDDYLGGVPSHSYFLGYLPGPEMTTIIQGETLIEHLDYIVSSYNDHENQMGQSKFRQLFQIMSA